MTYFLRWSRTLLLIAAVVASFLLVTARWRAWVHERQQQRDIEDAVRSTAFRLTPDRWLEFELQNAAEALRILTNAAVVKSTSPPVDAESARLGWRYRIDYELYDAHSGVLDRKEYHLRTQVNETYDPISGENGLTWFDSSSAIPAQTRTIQIALDRMPRRAVRLRLKLGPVDPEISEVVVRTYMKYERQDFDQPYAWSRLSVDRRDKICRATVYPPDLLTERERRNLLRWNWAAIAPLGKQGRDYDNLRMYQREITQPRQMALLPPEDSVMCEPGVPLTFAVPHDAGQVVVQLYPEVAAEASGDAHVSCKLHREIEGLVAERQVVVSDLTETTSFETDQGGLLEIVADRYVTLYLAFEPRDAVNSADELEPSSASSPADAVQFPNRAVGNNTATLPVSTTVAEPVDTPSGETALVPTTDALQAHLIDVDGSLEYEIAHVAGQSTPFRLTLRRVVLPPQSGRTEHDPPADHPPEAPVLATWLDESGTVLNSLELAVDSTLSTYDQAALGSLAGRVSEPSTYYFAAPVAAARLRLSCASADTCAVAFTRPKDLDRVFEIPEETDLFRRQERSQRSWFTLRPVDADRRVERNLFVNLSIQVRPPERKAALIDGDYTWQKFDPVSFTVGRYFFCPIEADATVRPELAYTAYCETPTRDATTVQWVSAPSAADVEPRLVYSLAESLPLSTARRQTVRVLRDGTEWFQFVPRARGGEIELPHVSLQSSSARITIETEVAATFLLRGGRIPAARTYLKRFAHDVTTEAVTFPLTKETDGEETFILQPFFQLGAADPRHEPLDGTVDSEHGTLRRKVRLELVDARRTLAGPFRSWTLESRTYDVAPTLHNHAISVDGAPLRVDHGERCVFVLGEDLPSGTYQVRVSTVDCSASQSTFATIYRVHLEDRSRRSISSQLPALAWEP